VDDQTSRKPYGLSRKQLRHLARCADEAAASSIEALVNSSRQHLAITIEAFTRNRLINVLLAKAICDRVEDVASRWNDLPETARYWLRGAVIYFTVSEDEESDLISPIGFEDDAEVLNACLRFANLPELCLKIEDYDHA
jgi:hypothetical protein